MTYRIRMSVEFNEWAIALWLWLWLRGYPTCYSCGFRVEAVVYRSIECVF